MKQLTIYDLLPLLRNGWVAMDSDQEWYWFKCMPHPDSMFWIHGGHPILLSYLFDIAPFEGDWKDSLMECGK